MKNELDFDANLIIRKKYGGLLFSDIVLNENAIKNNKFTLHFHNDLGIRSMIKVMIHQKESLTTNYYMIFNDDKY